MPFIEAIGIAKHRTEQKPARTDNVYQPFHTLFRCVIYLAAVNVHRVALSRKGVSGTTHCLPESSPASCGLDLRTCNKTSFRAPQRGAPTSRNTWRRPETHRSGRRGRRPVQPRRLRSPDHQTE